MVIKKRKISSALYQNTSQMGSTYIGIVLVFVVSIINLTKLLIVLSNNNNFITYDQIQKLQKIRKYLL